LEVDKWTLITYDTAAMGGPCLLFDHHLAIDVEQQTLYVFGGRQIIRYVHILVNDIHQTASKDICVCHLLQAPIVSVCAVYCIVQFTL